MMWMLSVGFVVGLSLGVLFGALAANFFLNDLLVERGADRHPNPIFVRGQSYFVLPAAEYSRLANLDVRHKFALRLVEPAQMRVPGGAS